MFSGIHNRFLHCRLTIRGLIAQANTPRLYFAMLTSCHALNYVPIPSSIKTPVSSKHGEMASVDGGRKLCWAAAVWHLLRMLNKPPETRKRHRSSRSFTGSMAFLMPWLRTPCLQSRTQWVSVALSQPSCNRLVVGTPRKCMEVFIFNVRVWGFLSVSMPLHLGRAPLFRVIPGGNQKLHVIEASWPGVFLGSPGCFVDTASHFPITKFLAADVSLHSRLSTSWFILFSTDFWGLFGATCWRWVSPNRWQRTDNRVKIDQERARDRKLATAC